MKRVCSLLFAMVCVAPLAAQQNRPPRPKPVVSPIIGNGTVTFQIKAPEAREVFVSGQMSKEKVAMTRNDEGLWTATIKDVAPGIYEYGFTLDGVKMVDPGNPAIKPQRSPNTSILHLPGDAPHDFRADLPHGTVHWHGHFSAPIQRYREFQVYTPPGYETGTESYPLLVLQHGHGDRYTTWVAHGRANWILDNLIAGGKAAPMIVVMLDGHPIPESHGDARSAANTEELRRDLLEATLPMVEKLYRVKGGRENRAIAGLSMGGLHALTIGLNHLDSFAWIGSFSAAPPEAPAIAAALEDPEKTNASLKRLWIACGKDDFLLGENEKLTALLKEKSIRHEWLLTEGDHSWPVWRGYLADFLPRLFR